MRKNETRKIPIIQWDYTKQNKNNNDDDKRSKPL